MPAFISTADFLRRPGTRVAALIAALAMSLPACSAPASTPDAGDVGKPSKDFPTSRWDPKADNGNPSDLPKRIGYVNAFGGNTLNGPVLDALKAGAKVDGLEVLVSDPKGDNTQAIQQINDFVQRGVAGVFNVMLSEAMIPADHHAMSKGAMVIQGNGGPVTTMLSSVQYEGGYTIGQYVAKYAKETLSGDARIVWISQDFNESLKPRTLGFKDALEEAGVSKLLVSEVTPPAKPGATQDAGVAVMNSVLERHPDVNIVASASDDLALGAATAMKTAGAVTPQTLVAGSDGTDGALAAIESGTSPFKATSAVNFPLVGYVPGRLFGRWSKGQSVPQYVVFNYKLIASPADAKQLRQDTQPDQLPRLYDEMLAGDDTYITPLGSINYDRRGQYYDGTVPDKLPKLSFEPKTAP
jgi:ABC-type sugar transport system substrate-binding protein